MPSPHLLRAGVPAALALALAAPALLATGTPGGLVTTWVGAFGDWSVPGNWSDGLPTSSHRARIDNVGTALVTQPGAICRALDMIGDGTTLRIQGGTLEVSDTLHVGIEAGSTVQHMSGSVTTHTLMIGQEQTGGGAYTLTAGTLAAQQVIIPTLETFAAGSMSIAQSSTCTIAGALHIASAGSMVIGGTATLTVGGAFTLDGAFGITATPAVTAASFTMSPDGVLNATIALGQHAPILVTGPAVIDGTLLLTDVVTPDGSYELLRGSPLSGGFDNAIMSPGWSWRVSGNSLFADKTSAPVETVHWGAVKERYRE